MARSARRVLTCLNALQRALHRRRRAFDAAKQAGTLRQVGVSFDRLAALLPGASPETLVAHHPIYMTGDLPLEQGLDTLVGPRGVRLSGGQVQRTAAARMLVRGAVLLVYDDLSSALDVETERTLWEGLCAWRANPETTVTWLAVSHRRQALALADHIIFLKDGKVEVEGTLSHVLAASADIQRLWAGDLADHHSPA
ncbi:MAG: hypothetical protein EXR62_16780 [Chloroflexi bacterium]|nr:hypothetical protein [Chloroflexota bacterium]